MSTTSKPAGDYILNPEMSESLKEHMLNEYMQQNMAAWDTPVAWDTPTMGTVSSSTRPYITIEPSELPPESPVETIAVKCKMHKATIESYDVDELYRIVRNKLARDLVDGLLGAPGAFKVTKDVNPKSGAVTFKAKVRYVKQS